MSNNPDYSLLRLRIQPKPQNPVKIQIEQKEQKEQTKVIISDRRNKSNIDRNLIREQLNKKGLLVVNEFKPEKEKEEIVIPMGEPVVIPLKTNITLKLETRQYDLEKVDTEEGLFDKLDTEKEEKVDTEEDLFDKLDTEEEEEEEKEEKVDTEEDLFDKLDTEEEKETKIIEKKKRGRPLKKKEISEKIVNIDLDTIELDGKKVIDRLPKHSEKIIIKAPTYYMANRLLYSQKLAKLFQPYAKEIMSNETSISCDNANTNAEFELLTHQKIIRDYLNLYTPYRGLLLYHGLGAGKTCSSIALAEGMKTDKRVFIMTPASLKMNFFSEMKKCGDHLYKKNQFWEFVSIEGKPNYVSILAKALSLKPEYIIRNNGAWLVNIKNPANFTEKTSEEQKEIDDQLNEMIRTKYIDINYNGINMRGFQRLVDEYGENPFDNSVILIDEAHNFVSRIVNKLNKPASLSYKFYDLLMNASNARIVFMTGTPIINYSNEIGILFNILRGYIKTWSIPLTIKTNRKINTSEILEIFDKNHFTTFDFVEYTGNTLNITRNPFGFINIKKSGPAARGTKKIGGYISNNKSLKKKTRNLMGGNAFEKYNGVRLGESGNISDNDFINHLIRILTKENIEINKNAIEVKNYKALPDISEAFFHTFIDTDNDLAKNIDVFKKRILGLTSYFRSAQEQLLPRFILPKDNSEGEEIFFIVKCAMTPYQFDKYQEIRNEEAEKEKKKNKRQKKVGLDNDMHTISSSYRIFSRSACNFVFPPEIVRPMPDYISKDKPITEEDLNGFTVKEKLDSNVVEMDEIGEIDNEEEKKVVNYQSRIAVALNALKENGHLTISQLGRYSPKFIRLLTNIQSEENIGLHLVYSQFRTIEGIGIIKLILESNGYAEFKLRKEGESWQIVEDAENANKPKFVLYTGTESAEEKEIVRNIYNSNWEFVPSTIANRLREMNSNNFMGEIVKVFMITSSGAEGINLKNTRFVHIVEPYWNMVRIEQVIGRARRICSHQDLPEDLRTVKVFLYVAELSDEQKDDKNNATVELRNRDTSRLDGVSVVTTDQTLFEIAKLKNIINRQFLKAIKESAMDCSLYSAKNADEQLICYGSNTKIESNNFDSFPSLDTDMSQKTAINLNPEKNDIARITFKGKEYAVNMKTNEVFDYTNYLSFKNNATIIGHLIKNGSKNEIKFLYQ
jgi:hypothetical protein